MNFQKIQIHRGDPVNLKNYDFILPITLPRINILTSSFFLGFSLSKALHLTPKMLKSEKFFFDLIREVWLSLEGLGNP